MVAPQVGPTPCQARSHAQEKDAKLACKQFLEYKGRKGNSAGLRLDREWFQYASDRLVGSQESPVIPPRDTLDDVEFGEFPLVRGVVIHDFTAKGDIRSGRAANRTASRKRSRSRSAQDKGNKVAPSGQNPLGPVEEEENSPVGGVAPGHPPIGAAPDSDLGGAPLGHPPLELADAAMPSLLYTS